MMTPGNQFASIRIPDSYGLDPSEIEFEWWEPCQWCVAWGHVDKHDFAEQLNTKGTIGEEVDHDDVVWAFVREMTPAEKAENGFAEADMLYRITDPDNPNARRVTLVEG